MTHPRRLSLVIATVAAFVLLHATTVHATVTIPGGNIGTQTWTASAGPYVIQGDVTVLAGATLTIQAGTEVQIATTDMAASGADTSRVEFIVNGTVVTSGTAASPVVFHATTAGTTRWVGIRINGTATSVNFTGVTIRDASVGIDAYGSATIDTAVFTGNNYGARANTGSTLTVRNTIATANSVALTADNTLGGTLPTLNVANCTLHANTDRGIYGAAGTVTVVDTIVTNNSLYGVYRSAATITVTYSNVWGNPTNYSGVSGGSGSLSANPLYVSAPTNLRLTSNSPSRNSGMTGGDQGALPYTTDPTPALVGTLWADTVLSTSASPYAVPGDLTVAPGVRLTIPAGVALTFATTDQMASGADTSRAELIVNGTLATTGTASTPVTFAAATAGTTRWVGIRINGTATNVSLAGCVVRDASVGVDAYGTATVDGCTLTGNNYAARANTGGNLTVRTTIATANSVAVTADNTLGGTLPILNVTNCTLHANTDRGIYGAAGTVNVVDSIITNNSLYGVYRSAATISVTYTNVWGNPTNYSGVSGGTGTIASNPLYVSAPSNLRLTSNSPSRNSGITGGDQGALPYTGDATPSLVGTLWTDTTLSAASSPYAVPGDLTVAPGVRLAIPAGVTLSFATTDMMAAGVDTSRAELTVNGTIVTTGTAASPVVLSAATAGTTRWVGVRIASSASGVSLAGTTIRDASVGLDAYGTAVIDGCTFTGDNYGARANTGSTLTVRNAIATGNSVAFTADNTVGGTTPTLNLMNCTMHANTDRGVYGAAGTVNVTNCLITNNSLYGVYRSAATITVTYSDVWGNPTNYSGVSAGTGCLSINPFYVGAPTDLRLSSTSSCIDSGTNTGAPAFDFQGTSRPIDGDGVGGAVTDMGAYEYFASAVCGNGVREGTEVCDDGARNGTYGYCNGTCTGAGPRCGDSTVNGPEECDDGNTVDTDACRNTCLNARCGDGVVRTGVEQCDDGNTVATDACTATCTTARCGDGIVQSGVEQCDDANTSNTDACVSMCLNARCGDGFVQAGVESCDDGTNNGMAGYCNASCTGAAPRCGDGVVNGTETCDDGARNGMYGACNSTCTGLGPRCGDNMVNGPEECDDGNTVNTDACLSTCVNARCGDGVVRAGVEQCDDGNAVDTDACRTTCVTARCGDGVVQTGVEQCDDGNTANTDACVGMCVDARCGDGFVYAGHETCDDGTRNGMPGYCASSCTGAAARCGDGVVNGTETCDDGPNNGSYGFCNTTCTGAGLRCGDGMRNGPEECDDGNSTDTDACRNSCLNARCGDGVVQTGVEECDDANTSNTDSCTNLCVSARCGDGLVQSGVEQCDDGNMSNTDNCTNACTTPRCGDGFVQSPETCDDGNTAPGDGCSATCTSEGTTDAGPYDAGTDASADAGTDTGTEDASAMDVAADGSTGVHNSGCGCAVPGDGSRADAGRVLLGLAALATILASRRRARR